eukprot:TRINITY_DN36688_c0_g1_i1.p1 TRINITY_DN36688_c0_g1~~TRINITY_DN36688_c0_g1_i1.p1  ORF type:complete len:249 (+),score=19.03 TRINITY_DN36688_c0_g1_i1:84-830(+)
MGNSVAHASSGPAAHAADEDVLQGGDVVCVRVRGQGDAAGRACTNVSWCTESGLCLTAGDYAVGDRLEVVRYRGGTQFSDAGEVVHVENDGGSLPDGSTLAVFAANKQCHVRGYCSRATGNLSIAGPGVGQALVPIGHPPGVGAIQGEFTEPLNGRRVKLFGFHEGLVDAPLGSEHSVTPVTCNASRLKEYHKGAVFRHGKQAHCVYVGNLLGPERDGDAEHRAEWAACLNTSRVCELLPDLCTQKFD